ncbi:alpha/beta fold hydrolase [Taibaiella koreensis]|uniref:alpha/beta fold hydrolase n=1 Tax=Taibaiella koreensis TaxID=1268548 RepID=UPI000E599F20|nr:alpha/beta hydrolase [Taibaiella koreensis]
MTTYFIGGIATDERFYAYPLSQIPDAVYLPFPAHTAGESMAAYCLKFLPLINSKAPFNLVGNSMGGIMVMELLKHVQPEKVILISSVKCRSEMPWRLRQLRRSKLHRLLPGRGFIAGTRYGGLLLPELRRDPAVRRLTISMARHNDPAFLYWCVNAIVNWQGGDDYRRDIIHIHGTRDSMFPYRNLSQAIPVEGGTHLMQLTRKEELTRLLLQYL